MSNRDEQIINLWNENHSALQIGMSLGVTRNTVIGVVSRARPLGLITRKFEAKQSKKGRDGSKLKKQENPRLSNVRLMFPIPIVEEQQLNVDGVSLFKIAHNGCRFPKSRVDDQHYFCGKPKRDAKTSYCSEHHDVVWIKASRVGPAYSGNERRPFSLRKLA